MSENITVQPRYDDVEIAPVDLYWRHYDGQHDHQPVVLSLDLRDGELLVDNDHSIGGTPADVWEGRVLWFDLPEIPTPAAANALLDRVAPMAQAILDAATDDDDDDSPPVSPWDESAWDGTPSAFDAASAALEEFLDAGGGFNDSDIVAVWHIDGVGQELLDDVTAAMDDDAIETLADQILSQWAADHGYGAAVCDGLAYWLRSHRDELRAEVTA